MLREINKEKATTCKNPQVNQSQGSEEIRDRGGGGETGEQRDTLTAGVTAVRDW